MNFSQSSAEKAEADAGRLCPACGERMVVHSTVRRHYRTEEGRKHWIRIRRLRCKECGKIHRQLPDAIQPYKHYLAEVIEGELESKEDAPGGPDARTLVRWRSWFTWVRGIMEAVLVSIQIQAMGLLQKLYGEETPLAARRGKGGGWLADSMRKSINAGYPAYIPSLHSVLG